MAGSFQDEGSDDEVTLFTRNIPSLNSQVLTDFLEDPSEAEALISSEKTTTADKEKKTSSGFSLVASTSSTQGNQNQSIRRTCLGFFALYFVSVAFVHIRLETSLDWKTFRPDCQIIKWLVNTIG